MSTFALLLLAAPDASLLGHPSYPVREQAECRLRAMGALAWPVVSGLRSSADPEVRARADRLLIPMRRADADRRAYECLVGPWPPPKWAFWHDEDLRARVYRQARTAGCLEWEAEAILPGWEYHPTWWWWNNPDRCYDALIRCRARLGAGQFWPFN